MKDIYILLNILVCSIAEYLRVVLYFDKPCRASQNKLQVKLLSNTTLKHK